MKKILAMASATLMGASLFAAPALAQDFETETGGIANADAATEGVDQPRYSADIPMPSSRDHAAAEYLTGGQYNASVATEGSVSPDYTGSIFGSAASDAENSEYQTGGLMNADEVEVQ